MEAIEKGLVPKELLPVATSFSGGMGSGCLCGAIAGSQIVLGYLFGKENQAGNDDQARATAREFISEFFGDLEEAPDLNEFLSRFTCSSCGKRCLLASPSCFVGNGRQESAVEIYQEMYPEVEL